MDRYTLLTVDKTISGVNSIESITEIVRDYKAESVLIVTDEGVWNAGLIEKPKALLESAGVHVVIYHRTPPEPELEQVNDIYRHIQEKSYQMVIGIGGGSAMDVSKLLAVMMTNEQSLSDMIGTEKIALRGIPTLMIPTTAGTGAEVTPNAIILIPEEELKVGVVSAKLMPNCVILDPVMTLNLPKAITASTGMDALAHAIECYISKKSNPFSDMFALKAIQLISSSLRTAYLDGHNLQARHDMMLGAMYGGVCISTSSTTAVHALSYPLGGKYRIPHGLSNAILLPQVMQFNLDGSEAKFKDIAIAMGMDATGKSQRQSAEWMIENLYALLKDLNIVPSLRDQGITEDDLDTLVEAASKVTRLLDNNPKTMDKADIRAVYEKLL